jgi:hypothetical protein
MKGPSACLVLLLTVLTPTASPARDFQAYLVDCNNQETLISNLLLRIENAEQLMAMKLDTARNQILVVNMSLQTTSVLIGFGAYVTGTFTFALFFLPLLQLPSSHLCTMAMVRGVRYELGQHGADPAHLRLVRDRHRHAHRPHHRGQHRTSAPLTHAFHHRRILTSLNTACPMM